MNNSKNESTNTHLEELDPHEHQDALLDELWSAVPTPFHGFSETRMCRIRGTAVYVHKRRGDYYRQISSGKVIFASRDLSQACHDATQAALQYLSCH